MEKRAFLKYQFTLFEVSIKKELSEAIKFDR